MFISILGKIWEIVLKCFWLQHQSVEFHVCHVLVPKLQNLTRPHAELLALPDASFWSIGSAVFTFLRLISHGLLFFYDWWWKGWMQALRKGDKRSFLGSVNILPRESRHKDPINLKKHKTWNLWQLGVLHYRTSNESFNSYYMLSSC